MDEIAPSGLYRLVRSHQDPQSAGRGNLLALHKVGGDVLGNLTAHQLDRAYVGLPHTDIFDNGEFSVTAHGSAHVQLGVSLTGHVHRRVGHIAPDITLAIGDGGDGAQRAAAADAEGHRAVLIFQHIAHHGRAHEQTAQGGSGHRPGVMNGTGPLHQIRGGQGSGFDGGVFGNDTYKLIHKFLLFLSCCKENAPILLFGRAHF